MSGMELHNRLRTPAPSTSHIHKTAENQCPMLERLTRVYRQPFRSRRAIVFSTVIFMVTTGLLYVLVEFYTVTANSISTSSSSLMTVSAELLQSTCQLDNAAIKAINMAPSDYCKEQLRDIACRIGSRSDFYPWSLPQYCPLQKGHFGEIVGCVSTDANSTESGEKMRTLETNLLCIDYCLKLEFSFAEYNPSTGQCLCFSTFDDEYRLTVPDKECPEHFFKDENLGQNTATLYRTGYVRFGNHLGKRSRTGNDTEAVIIFLLTVGGRRNLRQIQRLVRAIYLEQHYYLIHVDKREEYLQYELANMSKRFSNIRLTNKRYPTTWGASTLLTAHVDAFKQIFEELRWNFSFVINLSESDYPVKSIQSLTNILSTYPSYNFLRSHGRNPLQFLRSQGIFHTFVHCNDYMYRLAERNLTLKIVYDGGSDWYVLNREFVHYVTYGDDELINGLRHTFKYTLLPCETFFHTLLINSIYCDTYIRNNLRLVHWDRKRGCKCQHRHVVDWCGCSPVVYRSIDQPLLLNATHQPLFFARKFDPTIDEAIIDWLDEKVSKRNISNGACYLQNIYHFIEGEDRLSDKYKMIDSYARTVLDERGRNGAIELEQIHSVYQMSIFQGYSLQYRSNVGEQFEILIKLSSLGATRSDAVKTLEVGLGHDQKELVFTDRSRTFIKPDLIEVLIEWEAMSSNDTALVVTSPSGTVHQRVQLLPSSKPLVINVTFSEIPPANVFGIWSTAVMEETNGTVLTSLDFLVLSTDEESSLKIESLVTMAKFWKVSSLCSTTPNSTLCRASFDQTIPTSITAVDDCFQQPWSVFFFDVKSNW